MILAGIYHNIQITTTTHLPSTTSSAFKISSTRAVPFCVKLPFTYDRGVDVFIQSMSTSLRRISVRFFLGHFCWCYKKNGHLFVVKLHTNIYHNCMIKLTIIRNNWSNIQFLLVLKINRTLICRTKIRHFCWC